MITVAETGSASRIEGIVMSPRSQSGTVGARRGFWRDGDGGNVSLELAFVITFLAVLVVGAVDFGRYAVANLSLASAARAGAQYGMQDQAAAAEATQMVQAARDDAGDEEGSLTVTARQYCSCPGESEVLCSVTCGDGTYPEMYVEVTAADELELLFDYPGIAQPLSMTWTSEIRVR